MTVPPPLPDPLAWALMPPETVTPLLAEMSTLPPDPPPEAPFVLIAPPTVTEPLVVLRLTLPPAVVIAPVETPPVAPLDDDEKGPPLVTCPLTIEMFPASVGVPAA